MRSLILKPLYGVALDGLPMLGTPAEAAGRVLSHSGSLHERAEELASAHLALCASTGFVCGLGGFLTLPITLPVNVAGVALMQLHLCAATAFLGGHDPYAPATRDRVIACLTGAVYEGGDRDETAEVVDRSAVKIAERGLRLAAEAGLALFEAAGKFSAKRLAGRFSRRSLPLVGGMIGGASDLYNTRRVAMAAREAFLPAGDDGDREPALFVAADGSLVR